MSVQLVKEKIEQHLNQIKSFFVDGMELTFIARKPDNDRADFVVTNDSLPELAKVIERMSKQAGARCEVQELRAERDRFKAALEQIADFDCICYGTGTRNEECNCPACIAAKAVRP